MPDDGFETWLHEHQLADLAPVLRAEAIDSVDTLAELTSADFRELGIPIGVRKRIANALATTRRGRPPDAAPPERRQLTVMFCDVVESTPLSQQLDPEDLADVYRAYTECCTEATERYEGRIDRFLGDGVLGYFGFPRAHEDDAARAILAGFDIVAGTEELARTMQVPLAVRVGITTGVVVVGDLYANPSAPVSDVVVGDTPNLAARIQSVAPPNAVVVSDATRRLAGDVFEFEDIGEHVLKGFVAPVHLHRARRERTASLRFHAPSAASPSTFVGRQREAAELTERWVAAAGGRGQAVHIVGEAGHGKSRLAHELIAGAVDGHVVRLQCSSLHRDSAFFPVIQSLRREVDADSTPADPRRAVERLLAPADGADRGQLVEDLVAMLEPDGHPGDGSPRQVRQRTLEGLAAYLVDRPAATLVLLEDAHWADASTLELVGAVLPRLAERAVLLLVTSRPELVAPWAPHDVALTVEIGPLTDGDAAEVARAIASPLALTEDLLAQIVAKGGGVPLFVEELTRTVVESLAAGREAGSEIDVPSTLADSLLARVDRLGPAKPVSQLASAIGQDFDEELLGAVASVDPPALRDQLRRLVESDIVVPTATSGSYVFKHALVRDVTYQTMLRARRREVHGRIADALAALRTSDDRERPEVRARHLTEAGRAREAVDAWTRAGERAAARSASVEAIAHLDHGLALIGHLAPDDDSRRRDVDLQVRRAGMLRVSRGFGAPETGEAYERARAACVATGDRDHLIPVLNGLYSYHLQHDYRRAGVVADELLAATVGGDARDRMIGHKAVGVVAFHVGAPTRAVEHLSEALSLYDEEQHAADAFVYGTDHAETLSSFLAMSLWLQGRADEAFERARWAVWQGDHLHHLPSTAQALVYLCFLGVLERQPDVIDDHADRLVAIAERISFPLLSAAGRFWAAVGRAFAGRPEAAIDDMVSALDAWRRTGSHGYLPFASACLAETLAALDRGAEALDIIDGAVELAEQSAELWCAPELDRVRARLLAADDFDDAERVLRRSLDLARSQGGRPWEMRSACTLAEHVAADGRLVEALAILDAASGDGATGYDAARLAALSGELRGRASATSTPR